MKNKIFIIIISATLITTGADAQVVTLKQIGKDNMLMTTNMRLSLHASGILYTIDQTAAIYKTDLSSGDYSRIGKVSFNNLKFFFLLNNKLYVIDYDESMTEIDPVSGHTSIVSSMGYWNNIARVVVVANSFYAIENGVLYKYFGFNTATRKPIGEANFYNVGTLIRYETALYSMTGDGSFSEINTNTGELKKIGKSRTWSGNLSAVIKDKLYTISNSGALYEISLSDGSKKLIDDAQFKNTVFLFEDAGKLYTSTRTGRLYEIVFN